MIKALDWRRQVDGVVRGSVESRAELWFAGKVTRKDWPGGLIGREMVKDEF